MDSIHSLSWCNVVCCFFSSLILKTYPVCLGSFWSPHFCDRFSIQMRSVWRFCRSIHWAPAKFLQGLTVMDVPESGMLQWGGTRSIMGNSQTNQWRHFLGLFQTAWHRCLFFFYSKKSSLNDLQDPNLQWICGVFVSYLTPIELDSLVDHQAKTRCYMSLLISSLCLWAKEWMLVMLEFPTSCGGWDRQIIGFKKGCFMWKHE